MHDLQKAMASASSAMSAQSVRLRLVSENIANAETPGYRRKLTSFETEATRDSGVMRVRTGPVRLSEAVFRQQYSPAHPMADDEGMLSLSNVDPLIELADAREAQRSYEASLGMFDRARRMHGSMLDLLRR